MRFEPSIRSSGRFSHGPTLTRYVRNDKVQNRQPTRRCSGMRDRVFWTRGDIAKEKGVTATSVANWDTRGLLIPDAVTKGGIKLYGAGAVAIGRPRGSDRRAS